MKNDNKKFKTQLEQELKTLEGELKTVSRKNPDNEADWEAVPENMDILPSDPNEVADSMEAFEENTAITKELEIRYNEVKSALSRIADGTFGICNVCKKPIETKRLEANPAALTCQAHMGK